MTDAVAAAARERWGRIDVQPEEMARVRAHERERLAKLVEGMPPNATPEEIAKKIRGSR